MQSSIKWIIISLFMLFLVFWITRMANLTERNEQQTILAVFAHPDDEFMVSAALSRFAREGAEVYLAVASDGRYGVSGHADIPAGDSLAAVRADELRCSADNLGINPPRLLGLPDGFAHRSPELGRVLEDFQFLHNEVEKLLDELSPDVVITWGPGGGYGHPDHRSVSNVVTEVIQLGGKEVSPSLLYTGLSSDKFESMPEFSQTVNQWFVDLWHPVHPDYLTVRIPYEESDLQNAREALDCHRSQFTEADRDELIDLLSHAYESGVTFQPWNNDPSVTAKLLR